MSEPAGFDPGPGLRLVEARQRMERAVLSIHLQGVTQTYAGSEEAAKAYAEMSNAARHLVLAQNAWDDYVEAKRAERMGP